MTQQKHDNNYRVLTAEASVWAERTADPRWHFLARLVRLLKQLDQRVARLERMK